MPCVSGNVWALIIQILMFYHNYWGAQVYTLLRTLNLANLVTTWAFLCDFIIYGPEENVKLCLLRATSGGGVTHIFAYTSPNLCISHYLSIARPSQFLWNICNLNFKRSFFGLIWVSIVDHCYGSSDLVNWNLFVSQQRYKRLNER